MRLIGWLTLMLAGSGLLYGQDQATPTPAVAPVPQEEAQRSSGALGELQPLTTSGSTEGGTYVLGSVNSSVSFDDNTNSDNAHKLGGVTYELMPSLGFRVIRPSLTLEAQYGPGWSWRL